MSIVKSDTLQIRDLKKSFLEKNVAKFRTLQINTIIKNQKVEAEASKFQISLIK